MHETDRIIERLAISRQPRVLTVGEGARRLPQARGNLDADNIGARTHHVGDAQPIEARGAQDHVLVADLDQFATILAVLQRQLDRCGGRGAGLQQEACNAPEQALALAGFVFFGSGVGHDGQFVSSPLSIRVFDAERSEDGAFLRFHRLGL
jgi:hypothetical protein